MSSYERSSSTHFTSRELRDALGLFPTGITVVTAAARGGYDVGVTVNSFTSVSLEPPLVCCSLARSLRSLDDFLDAGAFAINLLREDQGVVSSTFARARADKWACVRARRGATGSPILVPNLAVFECETYAQHEAGDHVIVVGRVLRFEASGEARPLVFYRGRYCAIGGQIQDA